MRAIREVVSEYRKMKILIVDIDLEDEVVP
jgi:hypothetical protein